MKPFDLRPARLERVSLVLVRMWKTTAAGFQIDGGLPNGSYIGSS